MVLRFSCLFLATELQKSIATCKETSCHVWYAQSQLIVSFSCFSFFTRHGFVTTFAHAAALGTRENLALGVEHHW